MEAGLPERRYITVRIRRWWKLLYLGRSSSISASVLECTAAGRDGTRPSETPLCYR